MALLVVDQFKFCLVVDAASPAGEAPLPGVDALVSFQVGLGVATLQADGAHERLLASVNAAVDGEVVSADEVLPADIAVRVLASVAALVLHQISLSGETLPAFGARIRFLRPVSLLVTEQVSVLGKGLPTLVANEWPLTRVTL